jgi:hypothetical protein
MSGWSSWVQSNGFRTRIPTEVHVSDYTGQRKADIFFSYLNIDSRKQVWWRIRWFCMIWAVGNTRRMPTSGMLHHVRTDFSEECYAPIIGVTRFSEVGTTLAVTSNWHTLRRNTYKSQMA